MDFLFDPTLWVGLLTLVVLELVLGIDNLVFIAILAKKLPAKQQDRALYTGLGMAIFLRLALLSVMSWLVGLTAPLFTLWGHPFSLRDLFFAPAGFSCFLKPPQNFMNDWKRVRMKKARRVLRQVFGW